MKKRMGRKKWWGLLAAVFLLALSAATTAGAKEIVRLSCGANVEAALEDTGVLTISGTGEMANYTDHSPFYSVHSDEDYSDQIYRIVIEDGVTSVGDCAFKYLYRVQSVSIPSSVRSIGRGAFYGTAGLFQIDIPGSVAEIGEAAFRESGLKMCTLHEGLKVIGERAFYRTNLTSVNIPNGVSVIEGSAFQLTKLAAVTIPEQITIIKSNAFPKVAATIYSRDVTIGAYAFETGSTLKGYRGSSADVYAKNYGLSMTYFLEEIQVKFEGNGGSVSQSQKSVYIGQYYGTLPVPARGGFAFAGWYTSPAGGTLITKDTEVTETGAHTLYARWTAVKVEKCRKPALRKKGAAKIQVTFAEVKNAQGYEIRYSKKSNMKKATVVTSKTTSKTLKKLKKKTTYYVQVRAFRQDSAGNTIYGQWSKKGKIKL